MACGPDPQNVMVKDPRNRNGLTRRQWRQCRELLEQQRAEVIARVLRHEQPARQGAEGLADPIDQASHDAEQANLLRLLDQDRQVLREIDHALAKFDDGTYGLCEGTRDPIETRRLLARPWARYSVTFMELLEETQRGYAGNWN